MVQLAVNTQYTPLQKAVERGDIKITNLPLEGGADTKRAFTMAATNGQIEMVKLLLAHGAKVDAASLYCAWNPGACGLHAAEVPTSRRVEMVKLLLAAGAPVNAEGSDHYTPLYSAVDKGELEIAKLFLEHGADINAKNPPYHETALHRAVRMVMLKLYNSLSLPKPI